MDLNRIGRKLRNLLIVVVFVATACAFPRRMDQEMIHSYSLNPEGPEGMEASGRGGAGEGSTAVLLVSLPQTRAGFDTERIVYLKRPHEVSYYAASEWVDTPARMLAPLLVRVFERSGAWRTVVRMPSAVRGDYRIDIDDLAVGQEFIQHPSRVRLTLRAQLVDLQRLRPIGTKVFEVVEPAPSEDAYGGVTAANRAVAKLLDEVEAWVSRCVQEGPLDGC
ncbi:MAG: ABC-type transport auxiliary lipoprotein family protein [Candidatus Manganitrophus sp.]|nr:ABC-type transport auxiliary lipoprotein family protein [Candidatus Manganitrophus sp.]MDC4223535.1 ABC-type transport auxiliary lipoprotein family protein [Candidatus Manganitrophus sp.]WDT71867.1 MAG: ABC-type transport auxiliary lipoprotein family protein [Candidatus Manganitrophus sp.]WDT80742.1 MAG: ABC-type transport auxiliary lipoprotein family protein [Candidatus Manganitrophus sp.]